MKGLCNSLSLNYSRMRRVKDSAVLYSTSNVNFPLRISPQPLFQLSWYCPLEGPTALPSWFTVTCISLYILWKVKAPKYTFLNISDVGERWNPATLTTKHISVLVVFPLLSFLFVLNSRNMLGGGTAHSFIQTAPAGPNHKSCLETHAHCLKNNPPSRVVIKTLLPKDGKRERKILRKGNL